MRKPILPLFVAMAFLASCSASQTDLSASLTPTASDIATAQMASPQSVAATSTVLAYSGPKLPGRWGIYVDARNAPSSYRAASGTCTERSYDIAADTVIRNAIVKTSTAAFDGITPFASAPGGASLTRADLTGALLVRVTRANGSLAWDETQAPVKSSASAELAAEVTVLNASGRPLGTYTERASALSDDGPGGCDGAEALVAQAYERASRMLLERVLPDIATN